MTLYHGGKTRIGEEIAYAIQFLSDIISVKTGVKYKTYCEPFAGMAGVYRYIPDKISVKRYLAGDANGSTIKMWRGKLPEKLKCDKKLYDELKYDGKTSVIKGFLGHMCSFRGVYFGSFLPKGRETISKKLGQIKDLKKVLKRVEFSEGDYTQFSHLKHSIIYCDPPYQKQNIYYDEEHKLRKFNNDAFWSWAEKMDNKDNLVIVSEYNAPKKWVCIFKIGAEKLFIHKSVYKILMD